MKKQFKTMLARLASGFFVPWRKSAAKTDVRIRRWVLEKGFCEPDMTMEEVARAIGISKRDLSSFCLKYYGDSFLSRRKRLRMEEAKRIMKERPDLPSCSIAEMVGVHDRSNFRRQFREVHGMTPSEWKETVVKNKIKH